MAEVDPFGLSPDAALRWFREKGYALSFDWRDTWGAEHARAFTVAKATRLDVLADLREAVDRAIRTGGTRQEFIKGLRPTLQEKGWWGEKEEVDPKTGETKLVELGSARRLRIIYETNLRQVHAEARWERIEATKRARPYLRYVCVLDGRERKEHAAWHNLVLPVDDPFWSTHAPPNGWGCRCKLMQLSARDLVRYGFAVAEKAPPVQNRTYVNERTGQTTRVPKGIDPSFAYNPGKARRGYTPPDSAPVLTPVQSFRDFGRPRAKEAQQGAPPAPALWPREHNSSDRARTEELFRALFGIAVGREELTITDKLGAQVSVSMRFLAHLRGEHKPPGELPDPTRTQAGALVRQTVEEPYEIWMVPYRIRDGTVVMRKRYIGIYGDTQDLVIVNQGDDGYLAWNTLKSRNIDGQRQGYLLYPR